MRLIGVCFRRCGVPSQIRKRLLWLCKPCSAHHEDGLRNGGGGDHAANSSRVFRACPSCGHQNRQGNKFCGMCGLPLDSAGERPHVDSPTSELAALESPDATIASLVKELTQTPSAASQEIHPAEGAASGTHHYHHHYHHHYFQGGVEGAVGRRRAASLPTARARPTACASQRLPKANP